MCYDKETKKLKLFHRYVWDKNVKEIEWENVFKHTFKIEYMQIAYCQACNKMKINTLN